jgi:hypothetical protein
MFTIPKSQTLLPPQVDFTSSDEETDHQVGLDVYMAVDRTEGDVLQESYPLATATDVSWSSDVKSYWTGQLGKEYNIGYTDQPVWIVQPRNASSGRAIALSLIGIGWGIVATLLLSIAKTAADLIDKWIKPKAG